MMIVPDGEDGSAGIVEGNGGAEEARRRRVIGVVADVIFGDEAEQEVLGEDHGLAHGLGFSLGEDDGLDGSLGEPLEHRPDLKETVLLLLLLRDPKRRRQRRRLSFGGSNGTRGEDGRAPEAGNGQSDGRHPGPATGSGGGEGGVDGEGRGGRRRHLHHHGRGRMRMLGRRVNLSLCFSLYLLSFFLSFSDERRWLYYYYRCCF